MSASSKMFIRTNTKFWINDPEIPQVLYGSQLVKGLYCIDQPNTENGVVCINYSWAQDSNKMLAWSPRDRFNIFRNEIRKMDKTPGGWAQKLADSLEPMCGADGHPEILAIDWQADKRSMGAFKYTEPGQEPFIHELHFQFQSVLDSNDEPASGVVLGGDSGTFPSGWVEGGLDKSTECTCAIIYHLGGEVAEGSPLTAEKRNMYRYR